MIDQPNTGKEADGRKPPHGPGEKLRRDFGRWFILYMERKMHQRRSRREKKKTLESADQKTAKLTAEATRWIAVFTVVMAIVAGLTLWELIQGGADTKALVDASKKQACAASKSAKASQDFAATAALINGNINDAVGKLDTQAKATQSAAKAATNQLGLMKKQLDMTERPWIEVTLTANTEWEPGPGLDMPRFASQNGGPLNFDQDGRGFLSFKLNMKNVGNSVAEHVYPRIKVLVEGRFSPGFNFTKTPLEKQIALCGKPNEFIRGTRSHEDRPAPDERFTIFPKDTESEYSLEPIDTKQLAENPPEFGLKSGKLVDIYIVGCVDYDYSFSSIPHQTGFIYTVYGKHPLHAIQSKMTFTPDQLDFEPYWWGGKYAY